MTYSEPAQKTGSCGEHEPGQDKGGNQEPLINNDKQITKKNQI